ncbi:hypothetical protein SAMN05421788_1011141 [Filimonas lacunae]|uniref:ABC-2 family transporter protein n=1 Tax=Filimonas lacunae TaxID=477680 RepID=A0A173MQD8_9BACT|nr:ABC transporter permease [Filimonas lacunae]BAV09706.1 ABC transporter protein [Filimonas lacunae]SIS77571.1 hypothetical protein SAMN05421788_1011141 [Filimonas lacunae]
MTTFLHSFQSEWLKKKHSAAAYLTITGGLLIPVIMLLAAFYHSDSLYIEYTSGKLWRDLYYNSWQYMGILLLPMGIILVASLVTQLEYKNNTWKQLHVTPQSYTVLFFAKLSVVMALLLQCFVLFTIGIYLCGIIPSLLYTNLPYPREAFPVWLFAKGTGKFLVACLPIVALQYVMSLVSKNFLVPIGVGIVLFIVGIIAARLQYNYWMPYCYCSLQFLNLPRLPGGLPLEIWAAGYTILFTVAGYIIYITRKDKS